MSLTTRSPSPRRDSGRRAAVDDAIDPAGERRRRAGGGREELEGEEQGEGESQHGQEPDTPLGPSLD
jgi:hypothetical protein